jgi:hypothetical protein
VSNAKVRYRRRRRHDRCLRRIDGLLARPKLLEDVMPGMIETVSRVLKPGWKYVATKPVFVGRMPVQTHLRPIDIGDKHHDGT